jgi:hypothetical protein
VLNILLNYNFKALRNGLRVSGKSDHSERVQEFYPAEQDLVERRLLHLGRLRGLDDYKYVRLHYPDLMLLLETGRNAEAFDSRDKIYGLLGLMDLAISNLVVPESGFQSELLLTKH